jgi:hypothetical protein
MAETEVQESLTEAITSSTLCHLQVEVNTVSRVYRKNPAREDAPKIAPKNGTQIWIEST